MDLAGKRIGLLTASASRAGGGVFEAVVAQADLVRDLGAIPVIFALDDAFGAQDQARFADAAVYRAKVMGPRQVGYAPTLVPMLRDAQLDLLHLHGIWMYPSRAGAVFAATTRRPYAISPHGMLDPWILARGRWKKAIARIGYERQSWARARRFHALTAREADDIHTVTGSAASVVIPNPAPPLDAETGEPAEQQAMPKPTFAYIGRIHPKKNLLALIDGWDAARRRGTLPEDATLRIAGWGDPADVAMLRARVAAEGPDVAFLGPVFGAEKAALLAAARYVVLPSHSEGLPMAMLEAWAAGRPTLMTTECNLPEGFAAGAAIDCGFSADSIADALCSAATMAAGEWQHMQAQARALAAGPFGAPRVREAWREFYADLLQSGDGR